MSAEFPPFDLYEELELSPRAGAEVIEAAWRRLSKKYHSDSSETRASGMDPAEAEARMKRINAAHDVLKSPDERASYDAVRAAARGRAREDTRDDTPSGPPAPTRAANQCPCCLKRYKSVAGLQWHRANVEACA